MSSTTLSVILEIGKYLVRHNLDKRFPTEVQTFNPHLDDARVAVAGLAPRVERRTREVGACACARSVGLRVVKYPQPRPSAILFSRRVC